MKDITEKLNNNYYSNEHEHEFESDVEIHYGIQKWPTDILRQIHWLAWERGHSSGHYEVFVNYDDLIDLVKIAREDLR